MKKINYYLFIYFSNFFFMAFCQRGAGIKQRGAARRRTRALGKAL